MGIFNWTKNKIKGLKETGKKVVAVEEIKKNSSYISEMAKILVNPKHTTDNARKESFQDAKVRLNVTEIDLVQNYKNMVYGFYISFGFAIVCFLGTLFNLFFQKNIMGGLSMLTILAVCLANSFRFSFRAFQIRHQKLCSAQEWWNRANEWFPRLP